MGSHYSITCRRFVNPPADWSLCPYTNDGEVFEKYTGSDYDTLQTSDDVVASQFTGYRMPTQEDFQELIVETDNEASIINGVCGWKFTNIEDSSKYIFLPATGICYGRSFYNNRYKGYYYSSSLDTDNPSSAWYLFFNSDIEEEEIDMYTDNRFYWYSVRAVS